MTVNNRLLSQLEDYFIDFKWGQKLNDKKEIVECFNRFDRFKNNSIDIVDFERVLKSLFRFNGNSYFISKPKIKRMFDFYKDEETEKIVYEGFEKFWLQIVNKTLTPRSAILVVDVQNDFIDGTLALKKCPAKQDGANVVPAINRLLDEVKFDAIAYTQDWHPYNHISFIENLAMRKISDSSRDTENINVFDTVLFKDFEVTEQKLWPAHCLQNTRGAEFHQQLRLVDSQQEQRVFFAKKGTNADIDSYSPFFNTHRLNETELHSQLQAENITDLYICGLAYDVCVASTALDALSLNYRVVIVEDACRGTDLKLIANERKKLINKGAVLVNSEQVKDMVNCKDRRPELAYASFVKAKYLSLHEHLP